MNQYEMTFHVEHVDDGLVDMLIDDYEATTGTDHTGHEFVTVLAEGDSFDHAARTLLRSEITAEFFSAPQRYLLGADMEAFEDEDGNLKPGWETVIGYLLVASRPTDDNDKVSENNPVAGQFPQASTEPHAAELRAVATMFAGETSIPVSYLGIVQDNPASADATGGSDTRAQGPVRRLRASPPRPAVRAATPSPST